MQLLTDVSSVAGGDKAACENNPQEMINKTEKVFGYHVINTTYGGPFYHYPKPKENECECTCKCKSIGPCTCKCVCEPVEPFAPYEPCDPCKPRRQCVNGMDC